MSEKHRPHPSCVICNVAGGIGALARAFALGMQAFSRPGDQLTRMCATHRRQVHEATTLPIGGDGAK